MSNYISNKELSQPLDGYIFRQSDPRVAPLHYGRFGRELKNVGCGVVAMYNVCQRLGKPQEVAGIIRDAERLRMPWLFGLFGTKPKSLDRYFASREIPLRKTTDSEELRNSLAQSDCAVICTWNKKRSDGIHFFTVLNDGGKLSALNLYDSDRATSFSADEIRDDRFIAGYLFPKQDDASSQ